MRNLYRMITNRNPRFIFGGFFFVLTMGLFSSCVTDIFATRPKLEMSYGAAALNAAKEANAETLAPQFYRRARDHYLAARRAYRSKDFADAKRHALAAKRYGQEAEFQALKLRETGGEEEDFDSEDSSETEETGAPGSSDYSGSGGDKSSEESEENDGF